MFRAALTWAEIKEIMSDQRFGMKLRDHNLDSCLSSISENLPYVKQEVQIAVGRRQSDNRTPDQARKLLDALLDINQMQYFDLQLSISCSFLKMSAESGRRIDGLRIIEDLKATPIGMFLQHGLERFEKLTNDNQWDDCWKSIESMHEYTAPPSTAGLLGFLYDPSVDLWVARIAEPFIPILKLIRRERAYLQEPLYLETHYHLALALFLTFDTNQTGHAHGITDKVRRAGFLPNWTTRVKVSDLEVLMVCLEIQLASYHFSKVDDAESSLILNVAETNWQAALELVANSATRQSEVRAAAFAALGLLIRHKRRLIEKEKRLQIVYWGTGEPRALLDAEMDFYHRALDLEGSSITHCYFAQCLISAERRDQARLHVVQALRTAPLLRLALDLEEELSDHNADVKV